MRTRHYKSINIVQIKCCAQMYLNFIFIFFCSRLYVLFTWIRTYVRWYIWVNKQRPFWSFNKLRMGGDLSTFTYFLSAFCRTNKSSALCYSFKINSWYSMQRCTTPTTYYIHLPLCKMWWNVKHCVIESILFRMQWPSKDRLFTG